MDDRPLRRKYARIERERRFVLDRLPPSVDPGEFERLDDLFVHGTHLRLRRVTSASGQWLATKLGQKIVVADVPGDARLREMTTIYLPDDEGARLASSLDGLRATKRRYKVPEQGFTFCIDVWEAPAAAAGIVVAEVEAESLEALEAIAAPSWATREVTDDVAFSAITLAARG